MIIYYEKPSWVSDINAWNIAYHEVASLLGESISYSIKPDSLLSYLKPLALDTESSAWMVCHKRINKK